VSILIVLFKGEFPPKMRVFFGGTTDFFQIFVFHGRKKIIHEGE